MTDDQSLDPKECAMLIKGAESLVAMTGAGLSTAAGIPDFRGPQGLYVTRRYDPEKVFEIGSFQREPQYFYEFSRDFVEVAKNIHPTFTHKFLAELEQSSRLAGIITQNIDLLHQTAGSRKVIELHGAYDSAACMACGIQYEELTNEWWEEAMMTSSTPPIARCRACDGILKPNIVFFGELVDHYDEAERMVSRCDLLLVLGSSLQVAPASFLPYSTTATTIVVNQGEVMLPPAPNRYLIQSDLDQYFQEVAHHLGAHPPKSNNAN